MPPLNTLRSWLQPLSLLRCPKPLAIATALFGFAITNALATDGTWTSTSGGNYSTTSNWSLGNVASGTGATATINNSGSIVVDTNQSIGTWSSNWGNSTSLNLSGSTGASLNFATSSGTPLFSTATLYSRYDNLSNLNIRGVQGLNIKTASNALVLKSGVSWVGFSGTLSMIPNNGDGAMLYAQAANVLPSTEFTMTPGNGGNGYSKVKLVLNSGANQTIGALNSSIVGSNTAYISSYVSSSELTGGSVTGTSGYSTITIGSTGNNGTFAGKIGTGCTTGGVEDPTANLLHLIKTGAGTQAFTGALTYSGTTTINNGRLLVSCTHSGGSVYTVTSGGSLGGTGAIAPVDATGSTVMIQIQSGGTLRSGSNGSGSLTLSGTGSASPILSFASGATATFDLSAGLSNGKTVIVGGTPSNDVTFNNTVFNFNDLTSGNLGAGQYVLFQGDANTTYSGISTDGSGNVTGGISIGTGLSAYPTSTLQVVGNNIVLNVVLPPPNTPTGLAVTGTSGGVSLIWNASSGASSYTIQRSTTSGSGYTTLATVSGTTFTDRSFVAGTTYYYVVSASNVYGTSSSTTQVSGTPSNADGTWTGGTGNYSDTTKWSGSVPAAGVGSTMTISSAGTITVDANVTIGSITAAWNNSTSLVLTGATGASLNFAPNNTASISTATYFSRNDYITNLNISGSSGLSFNGGSNDLVLQTGVTWNGFSGVFTIANTNNDGGIVYAQGNNVLPPVDLTMTPGNETNGFGNTKLILNGSTSQTIGSLTSTTTANNTAYISSYDGASSIGSSGTPAGTNTTGLATLNLGANNDTGIYSGIIGAAYNNSGNALISSTNSANLALNKLGTGTQTLAGSLFHTGTTTVTAGTLVITGTHAPMAISGTDTGVYVVSGSAMLAGTGLLRPASSSGASAMISVSGTLAPGWGAVGTLTLDGTNSARPLLSMASGAILAIDLGAGITNDKLQIVNAQAGDLIFNNNSVYFNDPTSGSLISGTYVLVHSDGSNAYSGLTTDGSGVITAGLSIGGGLTNYSSSTLKVVGNDIVLSLGASTVAGTPTGVSIAVSGTQVTLSWSAAINATSYTVYRSTTPNGPFTSIGTTSSLSFVDLSATNGQTYYYKVSASNGVVESPASTALVGTPLDPKTISIIGVNLRAYNTYGMAVSDTAGVVRVGYWNNIVGPCIQGETVGSGSGSLMNHLGNILPTVSVAFTAGKTTPNNYSNTGTLKFGSDAVTVNPATNDANLYSSAFDQYDTTPGTLSVTGIPYSSYDVIFYIYDGGSTQGGSITANGTTLSIRGGLGNPDLTGTGYVQSADTATASSSTQQGNYIRFSGLSGNLSASFVAKNVGSTTQRLKIAGFQLISNDTIAAPRSAPAAPASLTASGGNLQNVLNWSASSTATSYKIYRGTSSGTYTLLSSGSVSAPMLSFADTNVSNGTTYYYAVSAVNSVGEGVKSAEASATPVAPSFTAAQRIVYQYSLPMAPTFSGSSGATWPYDSQRRAYLWIPPGCTKVQGVMLGLHNMLEKPMFEDPTIRQACTDANIAILFVSPGDANVWTPNGIGNYTGGSQSTAITLDPSNYKSTDTYLVSGSTVNYTTDINNRSDIRNGPAIGTRFANQSEQAAAEVQVLLQNFATESGYAELAYAPIIMTDHSAGSSFLWGRTVHTSAVLSGRVVAIIPYKGTWGSAPAGVPILHISSEYQEISSWGNTWEVGDSFSARSMRSSGTNYLVGEFAQPGTGHYEYVPEQSAPIANFIKAVASSRIPANWSPTTYPTLNSIDPTTGWVIDVRYLGSGTCQPASYTSWVSAGNDPLRAYWYPDQTTAQSACDTMNAGFSKKPQMLNAFTNATTLASLGNQNNGVGTVSLAPTLQADGATFQVRGASVNQSPVVRLYNAGALGMPTGSIRYLVNNSGAVKQVGVDTFRIWMDRGSVIKTGQPWEPFVFAYHPGDSQYRVAYRPIQINTSVDVNLINGTAQTISFPAIPNQVATNLQSIYLNATASSGKPVQFFMASGPYRNDENDSQGSILVPDTAIPPQTKFPMRVVVGAWQWGTPNTLQSAPAVFKTFWIFKDQLAKWKFDNFGSYDGNGTPVTPSGSSDDLANPTGDGISNLMKYATGMSPSVRSNSPAAAQGTMAATISGTSGNVLTLTFNRIADATLTYVVESTDNLAGGQWTSVWSSTGSANTAGTQIIPDTVLVGDPAHPKRFMRLRVVH